MTEETRIEDSTVDQIGELLTQDGSQMGNHLAAAVQQFVEGTGGEKRQSRYRRAG